MGNNYVMNPQSGQTYYIQWGRDAAGRDAILSFAPAGIPPPGQAISNPAYAPPPPIATPGGSPPVANPVAGYSTGTLPGEVASTPNNGI